MAKQLNVSLAFTADTSQAKAQIQSLQQSLSNLTNLTNNKRIGSDINDELMKASQTAAQLKVALNSATDVKTGKLNLNSFNSSLQKAGLSLSSVRAQFNLLGSEGQQAFLQLARSIQVADAPLISLSGRLRSLANTFSNTLRWQVASSALHAITSEISSAYSYAQQLDKSLNDIRIVSGLGADEMAEFAKQANKAAQALSSTTRKYADAALIFYQQGLSDKEVEERTNATIKMANVTGEAVDDVSSYMTAVWNNFNKDGTQSVEHFGDVMTKLGADTAASTEEIAGGLEKFAAVADTIGLSFDYATAAITTIVDRTRQSEDVVGTALKTIFSRIQGLKQGETLDDGTDLNQYSEALANVGINIKDANNELKDMDDILDDIGERWDTLDRANKVALAQKVAGIRQYTQFMALFDNWDFMEQNLDIAYNADGTLENQAEIYAESWEAARKRVQAAAEEIYNSLIDKDFFIFVDDVLASTLHGISDLIDSVGGLKGVLLLIGTVATKVFKTELSGAIRTAVSAVGDLSIRVHNNLVNLTGKGEKRKTSGERLRENAAIEVNRQGQLMRKSGASNMEASMYEKIGTLQQSLLINGEKMTETERQISQELLNRQQIQKDIVLESQKELELENKKLKNVHSSAKGAVSRAAAKEEDPRRKGRIIAKNNGLTERVQSFQNLTDAFNELDQLEMANDETPEGKKALTKARRKATIAARNTGLVSDDYQAGAIAGVDGIAARADLRNKIGKNYAEYANSFAVMLESQGHEKASKAVENLGTEFQNVTDVTNKCSDSMVKFLKTDENAGDYIEKAGEKVAGFSDNIVSCTSGVTSITFGLSSLTGIWDTLSNAINEGNLSFSEFISMVTSGAMGIPMFLSGINELKTGITGLVSDVSAFNEVFNKEEAFAEIKEKFDAKDSVGLADAIGSKLNISTTQAEAIATDLLANSTDELTRARLAESVANQTGTKVGAASRIGRLLEAAATKIAKKAQEAKIIADVTETAVTKAKYLVLLLIIAAIAALVVAIRGVIKWWNKDAEALAKAKEATEAAKTSFDDAKSAYEELKTSITDYNDALDAINKLTKGTTEWKEAIQEINEKVIELLDTYPELAQYISSDENGMLVVSEEGQNAILAAQNAKAQNAYRNYAQRQIEENEAQNTNDITQFARSNYAINDKKIINKVLEDYQINGNEVFTKNIKEFAATYDTSVLDAAELINSGIYDLVAALNANTVANDVLSEQVASSALSQHLEGYNDEDFKFQSSLDSFLSQKIEDYDDTAKININAMSKSDVIKNYAAYRGIDESEITHRIGAHATIGDEEVSYDDMRKALQSEEAARIAFDKNEVNEFYNSAKEIQQVLEDSIDAEALGEDSAKKLISGLGKAILSNEDTALPDFFSNLTYDEITAAQNALSGEELTSALDTLYINNQSYFQDLGYKSATDFVGAFKSKLAEVDLEEAARQAEITQKENWQSSIDSLASELEVDANAVEGYAETLQDLYPELKNNTEATMDMARANIKFSKGFDSLVSAIDDNEDALKDLTSTSWLTQEALSEVGNAYEEMTGVNVSNDFIKEHLEEIKKLADGDISVIEQLGEAAAHDYVAHLSIAEDDIKAFDAVLDDLSMKGASLEIGASVNIDDSDYLATLNEMLANGELTKEQITTAFNSMGYSPKITYVDGEQVNSSHVGIENGTGLFKYLNESGFDAVVRTDMKVPVIQPEGHTKISSGKSLGSSIHPSQTTSGKKSSSGSKNEMEKYFTVTRQIEQLEKEYDKLSDARDKAWGQNAIDIINQEIATTEKLIQKNRQYINEIKKNLASEKAIMAKKYGAHFDKDGVITNYRTIFKKYGQTEDFQEALEAYESDREALQSALETELDKQNDLLSQHYDAITQGLEYNTTIVENDLKIIDAAYDALSDDVYKAAEALSYLDDKFKKNETTIDLYYNAFKDAQEAFTKGLISQADAVDMYQNALDEIISKVQELLSDDKTMMEYYGNTLEKAKEELSQFTDQIDFSIEKIQHFQKVQELSGQGNDYSTTLKFLKAQREATEDNYEIYKKYYESRKADEEEIEARLEKINKNTNPYQYELEAEKLKAAKEATQEAYNTMAEYRESYLELAKEEYETTIDQIKEYAEKALTNNIGFDSLLDSMSNLKTYADEYLTKTNQVYEMTKMERTLAQDLAKTNNAAAKQKLSNFAKEIAAAKDQNKLSNLELEILQAKYKQLQAQIALEEAQNAKNNVRLSRDAEGNYGYVYTADRDAIADAQQALDDADNDLYNIRLKAFNEYSEKVAQAKQELVERLAEIAKDETLSEQEKLDEMTRAREEYYDIIEAYGDMANIAQEDDSRIQADAWATAYKDITLDAENWKTTVSNYITQMITTETDYHSQIDSMIEDTKEGYENWEDAIDDTTEANEELRKKVVDEVIPALDSEIEAVDDTTSAYGKNRDAIMGLIQKYQGWITEINNAIKALNNLSTAQKKANNTNSSGDGTGSGDGSGSKDTKGTQPTTQPSTQPNADKDKTTTTYTWKIIDYANQKNALNTGTANSKELASSRLNEAVSKMNYQKYGHQYWEGNTVIQLVRQKYEYVYDGVKYSAQTKSSLASKVETAYRKKYGNVSSSTWKSFWELTSPKIITNFDTGGYTGSWGQSGKLAMLHEKELVLNSDDTKNFLAGINILRDIVQAIDLQAMYASNTTIAASGVASANQTLAQEVSIHAEFPNAVNHNEIEQAFDSLINRAAQYVNRK